MRKGCFVTLIVTLTIIVAAVLYIFQNHFDSLIMNPGKKIIASFIKNEFDSKLMIVVDSPEKQELKKLIEDYSNNIEKFKNVNEDDINKLIDSIDAAISDSLIYKAELEEIKQLTKRILK
jgi:arsenate reductase-like glutaredoxin family protein